ncbi:hypothetical protein SDC9_69957 [bioreactor metagenome]|uniref:RNA polymerase sigma factor 70 region 4 type 2 domain-containing protein n=1 Tax=bioreactor metagenome TaxID=1076179 RepID=A0A644YA83_9ZZZZ
MTRINLKDYYPFYKYDSFTDVTDDIADVLKLFERKDHADYERKRVHKAFYSLDADDGIERDVVLLVLSPQEIYERKLTNQRLYAAINSLPEKQAKRIYAHFFLGMSKAEIARTEGVDPSSVRETIEKGLRHIEQFLKNK